MLHVADASYRLDMQHAISELWSKRIAEAFRDPTKDQLQAYGRYCHTLSAAAMAGFVVTRLAGQAGLRRPSSTVYALPWPRGYYWPSARLFLKGEK